MTMREAGGHPGLAPASASQDPGAALPGPWLILGKKRLSKLIPSLHPRVGIQHDWPICLPQSEIFDPILATLHWP